MTDFIAIDITGEKEIAAKLAKLPPAIQDAVVEGVADLLLNIERHYPAYKYVSRKRAYPPTGWHSAKQRRFVMAAIREGRIKPGIKNRTQAFSRGWKKLGRGRNAMVVNEVDYGVHLKDTDRQAAMPRLIGWSTLAQDIEDHRKQIQERISVSARKAIKRVGLQTRAL